MWVLSDDSSLTNSYAHLFGHWLRAYVIARIFPPTPVLVHAILGPGNHVYNIGDDTPIWQTISDRKLKLPWWQNHAMPTVDFLKLKAIASSAVFFSLSLPTPSQTDHPLHPRLRIIIILFSSTAPSSTSSEAINLICVPARIDSASIYFCSDAASILCNLLTLTQHEPTSHIYIYIYI